MARWSFHNRQDSSMPSDNEETHLHMYILVFMNFIFEYCPGLLHVSSICLKFDLLLRLRSCGDMDNRLKS